MVKYELVALIQKYSKREVMTGEERFFEDLEMSWSDTIHLLQEIEELLKIQIIFADVKPRTPKGLLEYITNV